MQALEEQICETGMMGVGVNAIAKRAGISKELIYRYFGGMPGLMMEWMQTQDFWTGKSVDLFGASSENQTVQQIILTMLDAQIQALSSNEALKEIRRWELVERNAISAKLADRREKSARHFIDELSAVNTDTNEDITAIVSIMLAGVLYLSLRAKTEDQFLGVPLKTDEGWRRIANALTRLSESIPESLKTESFGALQKRAKRDNNLSDRSMSTQNTTKG